MSRLREAKIATPANPPAGTEEMFYASAGPGVGTPVALMSIDESGNLAMLAHYGILDYRLIKVVDVTSSPYVPSNGARALYVECVGAGGGGGGCATAATNAAAAGGGGSGAYSAAWLIGAAVKASFTVAVGALGTGGTAGANNGTAGGDTTFDSPSVCTAKGGSGGIADTVAAGPRIGGLGGAGGLAASGVGDLKCSGNPGDEGMALAAAQAASGQGGPAAGPFGGAAQGRKTQGAGDAATGFGGGGAGACILSGGASVAGGNGAPGLIRVWEWA